jgi:hypothetical protein
MESLLSRVLKESLIDFFQSGLSPHVWTSEGGAYRLSLYAEQKIHSVLAQNHEIDVWCIADQIHIVGSITTNLYVDDTDVDVHIFPKDLVPWTEDAVKDLRQWFDKNRESIGGYIGTHPIEVYIQTNPNQDLLSEGVYDVKEHKWLKGPKIYSEDYDPYKDFSDIANEIRGSAEDADLLLGELKRDVIDYDTIKSALNRMSSEQKKKFLETLQSKLDEIESDIQKLVQMKRDWTADRRLASQPSTPEQALQDVEMAKTWKDKNAIFKFLTRYRYLKVIKDLSDLVGDEEIEPKDVNVIKGIIGVPDNVS